MVRIDDSSVVTKCWLTPDELELLERAAGDGWTWEREVAMQLMGRCGLRADEVDSPGPGDIRWSDDGDCWLFEVRGKNTKGGEKTLRDAWMPDDVQDDIHKFARERGIADDNPWVDAATSTVRQWVIDAAGRVQEETGDERWRHVSSHDLRRSWATHHLVERQVDVRTMMAVGGWSDYGAIEPYLKEPTESRIGAAFREASG